MHVETVPVAQVTQAEPEGVVTKVRLSKRILAPGLALLILLGAGCLGGAGPTAPPAGRATEPPPAPTSTPIPTPAPTKAPTPIPETLLRPMVDAYAGCQGRYSGRDREERGAWLEEHIRAGHIRLAQVLEITLKECSGTVPVARPR